MLSTPAPTPISIIPDFIALATSTHACKPLEHCLFKLFTADVTGNPAASAAARNSVAPPPGASTVPTAMSSTRDGSMPEREMRDLKVPWRRSAAAVSLKPPLPPLVIAVRRAQVMTTWKRGWVSRRKNNEEIQSNYDIYIERVRMTRKPRQEVQCPCHRGPGLHFGAEVL